MFLFLFFYHAVLIIANLTEPSGIKRSKPAPTGHLQANKNRNQKKTTRSASDTGLWGNITPGDKTQRAGFATKKAVKQWALKARPVKDNTGEEKRQV